MIRSADDPRSNSTVGAGGDSSAPVVAITVDEAVSVPVTLLLAVVPVLVVEAEDDFSAPLEAIPVEEAGDCVPVGGVMVVVVVPAVLVVVLIVVEELFVLSATWKLALTVRL